MTTHCSLTDESPARTEVMVVPWGMMMREKRRMVDRNMMKGRLLPRAEVHWSLHSASSGTVTMSRNGAVGADHEIEERSV